MMNLAFWPIMGKQKWMVWLGIQIATPYNGSQMPRSRQQLVTTGTATPSGDLGS